MSREITTLFKGALLVVLVVGLVGCSYNKLKRENEELKAQVSKLNDALSSAESDRNRLEQEKVGLTSELDTTKAEYAAKQKQLEEATKKLRGEGFEVSVGQGMMIVTMPSKILYPSGSARLSSSGKDKLQQLSKTLNENLKGFPIEVQGHTDNEPIQRTKDKYASNWELSYDRAQTVVYYLIKSGIDPKRIHASAYGEYKTVASNSTNEGKAKNRRVEIVVMMPTGK